MSSVVILDEDVPVRELWTEWLFAEGHVVCDPRRLTAAMTSEIDVVLIDLPRLRAGALATIDPVRASYPQATLIGLSTQLGASLPRRSATAQELGLHALLAKPCSREELVDLLRSVALREDPGR